MNNHDAVKQEVKNVRKNYTRTPNILFEAYPGLHPQERWLFINLVYLCGPKGTRHLSIRYISQRTGISSGALSGSKNPEKNNPGMIRRLHNAGLIHAEIKKQRYQDGSERGQEQYHITIIDIWQLNDTFFAERSKNEHFTDDESKGVRNLNASVQKMNTSSQERSESERERSEFDTNIRLHNKITDLSNITEQDTNSAICETEPLGATAPDTLTLKENEQLKAEIAALKAQLAQRQEPHQDITAWAEEALLQAQKANKTELVPLPDVPKTPAVPQQTSSISDSQPTTPETSKRDKPVVERPAKPVMPLGEAKWCAETVVQIVEAKLGKYYRESARKKEAAAAQRMLREDPQLTRQQFEAAYDKRNDPWWQEHKGLLHLHHMVEKDRVHEMLDKIEAEQKYRGKVTNIATRTRQEPEEQVEWKGQMMPISEARKLGWTGFEKYVGNGPDALEEMHRRYEELLKAGKVEAL